MAQNRVFSQTRRRVRAPHGMLGHVITLDLGGSTTMRARTLAIGLAAGLATTLATVASPLPAAAHGIHDSVFVRGHSPTGVFLAGNSGEWVIAPDGRVLLHQSTHHVESAYRLCGAMVVTSATGLGTDTRGQRVTWRNVSTGATGTLDTTFGGNLLGPAPDGIVYAAEDFTTTAQDSAIYLRTTDGTQRRIGRVPGFVGPANAVCDGAGVAVLALPSPSPSPGQALRLAHVSFAGVTTTLARPTYSTTSDIRVLTLSGTSVLWSVGSPFSVPTALRRSVVGGATTTVTTVPKGSALVGAGGSATETVYTVDDGTGQTTTKVSAGGSTTTLDAQPFGADSRWWPVPGGFAAAGEDGVWRSTEVGTARVWQPPHTLSVSRVAGTDRYSTATGIQSFVPPPDVVYIASGTSSADALSGTPAAADADGALVLTAPTSLSATVRSFLAENDPAEVVVLGGVGSVSAGVEQALRSYAPTVRRVAGPDRYATAAAVSRDRFPAAVGGTVVVASGGSWADALAAGPLAARWNGPLLLTAPDRLPASAAAELERLQPERIVLVGGTGAASASVETALRAHSATVQRIAGADRYATAAAVSRAAFAPDTVPVAYVVTGEDFPDGLAAGTVAARRGGVVLPVARIRVPGSVSTELTRLRPTEAVVVGGEGVVTWQAYEQLSALWWP